MKRTQDCVANLYSALVVPHIARRTVAVLILIHTCLLAYGAYVHSPTVNEPGHLVAGLINWKFGRFDTYIVNPPLVRMVAALPVMAAGYKEDWSGYHEGPGIRAEFSMGEDFVRANGARSFFLFMIARWACIPFSWAGAIVCYLWARDLYSRPAGVMACGIWCFEPNILAHAMLIAPDAAAAGVGLLACYIFWRWMKKPSWGQATLAGVALGLAEVTKMTLIIFCPLWPLMWAAYRLRMRHRLSARDWILEGAMLTLCICVSLYVLNLVYGFEGSFHRVKDFQFGTALFRNVVPGTATPEGANPNTAVTHFVGNICGELPVPFPQSYILGIDLQQKDFEYYPLHSYLHGEWRNHGWWYYYLYACIVKVPLGLLLIGVFVLVGWMKNIVVIRCNKNSNTYRSDSKESKFRRCLSSKELQRRVLCDELILLIPGLTIFSIVSSKTTFNEHTRYVLPAFPFFFIFVAQFADSIASALKIAPRKCLTSALQIEYKTPFHCGRTLGTDSWRRQLVSLCQITSVLWFVASSLCVYPHSLSYFNESIGGPINGASHLLGSNLDWGQDLRFIGWWMERHSEELQTKPLHIAYFGFYNPVDVGFSETLSMNSQSLDAVRIESPAKLSSIEHQLRNIEPGVYAISANLLFGDSWLEHCKTKSITVQQSKSRFTKELAEIQRIGYSIYVFKAATERPSVEN